MKVSIITVCYNRENTIEDAIKSVLTQDYKNIEYIVIDGASKDNTLNIIHKYKDKISLIISEPDNGMYEGINKGIKKATGDIIGLLHSDDFFFNSHVISEIVSAFQQTNSDIIYGNGLFVKPENSSAIVRDWISGNYNKTKIKYGWLPLHPTVYIRKDCINKWGYYDESFKISADSDFLVRYLYKANLKVFYLKKYIVRMRIGGLSTSFSKSKIKWEEDLRLYKKNGFNPYIALIGKITSKIPQFIRAQFINNRNYMD